MTNRLSTNTPRYARAGAAGRAPRPRCQRRIGLRSLWFGLVVMSAAPGAASAQAIGPDVIVSGLGPITKWGTLVGISAYSISTTSCNIGDTVVPWIEFTSEHPVIGQQMYRVANGRIEQIGLSWVKHGFCALNETTCGTCQPTPCDSLGIGCADTYGSSLNGQQGGLGPRSDVQPLTGEFTYPFPTIGATGPVVYKRIQVLQADLNPALYPGAVYYYEAQYVHPSEYAWNTQFNNVSHRRFTVGALDASGYTLTPTGLTLQQEPAIFAWQSADPGVVIQSVSVPGDGELLLGARATDLGAGTWHYEYALYNRNSHRAVRSFSISVPPGTTVANPYFHDISHHSGEAYSTADWPVEITASRVAWHAETYAQNPNANAIYWGTLFNFAFDANAAPQSSQLLLGLLRPALIPEVVIAGVGPGLGCTTPDFVRGNMNGDASLDISDAVYMLAYLFTGGSAPVPAMEAGDANGDSGYDVSDVVYLLAFLFSGGSQPPYPFPAPGCL